MTEMIHNRFISHNVMLTIGNNLLFHIQINVPSNIFFKFCVPVKGWSSGTEDAHWIVIVLNYDI